MEEVDVPEPPSFESGWTGWAKHLSPVELEIAIRVIFDRWAWESGSKDDEVLLGVLEYEKAFRENLVSLTPGYDYNSEVHRYQDNYDEHV